MPHWQNISIDIKHPNVAGGTQSHTQCSIQDIVLHTLSAEIPIFHTFNQNFKQLISNYTPMEHLSNRNTQFSDP
jgi:hypothetical protein